jgi:flagellar protein FlaH
LDMPIDRVPTGIKELNLILEGGYPKGQGILVSGAPGVGKTILSIHLLYQSCIDGKKCELILTHTNVESFLEQAESIGFDFKPFLNERKMLITKSFEVRTSKIHNASRMGSGIGYLEKDSVDTVNDIPHDVEIVVIDNLDMLALYHDTEEFADKFFAIADILSNKKCTTLFLIGQEDIGTKNNIAEHIAFGIIDLYINRDERSGKGVRQLYIPKMRCTNLTLEPMSFKIDTSGINIETLFFRDEIIREALDNIIK